MADRVVADCEIWLQAVGAPIKLRAFSAGTPADGNLETALDDALRAMAEARSA